MEEVMPMKPATPRSRILAIATSHHTCIHMVWHEIGFCGIPMLQSPASAKPEPWWKIVKLPVYPFDRSRKGVNQWTIFLGYVRIGHRNMENEKSSQDSLRFVRRVSFGKFFCVWWPA